MKKILFLILLCCLSITTYGQYDRGINDLMSGSKIILKGDIIEFSIPAAKSYQNVSWTIPTGGYFSIEQRIEYDLGNSVRLKALKTTSSPVKIKVKVYAKNGNTSPIDNYSDEMDVSIVAIPEFTIVPVGSTNICVNNEITYRLDGVIPTGSQIYWNKYTNMEFVRNQGTNSAVFRATENGTATLDVAIWHSERQYKQSNSNVWIGAPSTPKILEFTPNHQEFAPNTNYTINALSTGASEYIWTIQGAATIIQKNLSSITIQTKSSPLSASFSITVSTRNACGQSSSFTGYGTVRGTGGNGDGPDLPINEKSVLAPIDQPEIKSVKIYNLSGVLVYSDNAVNGSFDIKSTVLTDGVYIIEKFDGQNRTSEKIMLKR